MGERGVPQAESVPVHFVPAPAPRGIASNGLLQQLQREGVTRKVPSDAPASQITEFVPVFDKSNVLSPILRTTEQEIGTANDAILTVSIVGLPNLVLVVRSLSVLLGAAPDSIEIDFRGRADLTTALHSFFFFGGPFPVSALVVGDVDSPLTNAFNALLPLALLPGDRIDFTTRTSVLATHDTQVNWFQELYLLPFRPAGL